MEGKWIHAAIQIGVSQWESMNAPSVPLSQKKLEVLHFLEEHQEL